MHDLFNRVTVHLGHHVFLTANTIGDACEELQLIFITDFRTENIVQRLDDLRQSLLLRIMGLATAHG